MTRLKLQVNERGISIVEVVLGLMIVVFIIMLLLNLPSSIALIGKSRQEVLAKEIVVKEIEDLRSIGYANLANGETQLVDSRLSTLPQGLGAVVVEDCPVEICTNSELVKQVTVTVTWKSSGDAKKVEVITLISEGGLK